MLAGLFLWLSQFAFLYIQSHLPLGWATHNRLDPTTLMTHRLAFLRAFSHLRFVFPDDSSCVELKEN